MRGRIVVFSSSKALCSLSSAAISLSRPKSGISAVSASRVSVR